MKVSEIMTKPVLSVHTHESVRRASALLAEHRITSMPVLDADETVVGIVSELDLLRDRIPHDPRAHLTRYDQPRAVPGRVVGEVMSYPVVCLSENADIADVANLMITNGIRAVPIISGPDLVGIVSRRDLLRTLLRDDAAICVEAQELLASYAGPGEPVEIDVDEGVVTIHGRFDDDNRRQGAVSLVETIAGVVRVRTSKR